MTLRPRIIAATVLSALAFALPVLSQTRIDRRETYLFAEDYGVVADGTTDNATALADVISAAASSGGTILLPVGVIEHTTGITLSSLDGIVFQGMGGVEDTVAATTSGTILYFDPIAAASSPAGWTITACGGIGFRDVGLLSVDGHGGDFITITDSYYCFIENCRIVFNAGEAAGLAAIKITSTSSIQCNGNRFYNSVIAASGAEGSGAREGYGIEFSCQTAASSAAVTDNSFTMCRFANFEVPGSALRFDGLSDCAAANNKFVNCYITVPADGNTAAGIDCNNGDKNQFMNLTVDGEAADTTIVFDSSADQNIFFGNVDGVIDDQQTDVNKKLVLVDLAGAAAQSVNIRFPFVTLIERSSASLLQTANGTMFVGSFDGSGTDTLWVRLNGAWVRAAP